MGPRIRQVYVPRFDAGLRRVRARELAPSGFVRIGARRYLPPHPGSFAHERTYLAILGPLGTEPTVAAECLFVDPIADLAVLCEPDGQTEFYDEAEAYEQLTQDRSVLRVGAVTAPCAVWLLTLAGQWEQCSVRVNEYGAATLVLVGAKDGNVSGTSGSPIVTADGCAVGIVSLGSEVSGKARNEQYGQPRLGSVLPAWLLAELNRGPDARKE